MSREDLLSAIKGTDTVGGAVGDTVGDTEKIALDLISKLGSKCKPGTLIDDENGNTLLHLAIINKKKRVAIQLIDQFYRKTEQKITDLFYKPCNLQQKNNDGYRPLGLAIEHKMAPVACKIIDELSKRWLVPDDCEDAMYKSLTNGLPSVASKLLSSFWNYCGISKVYKSGETALILAINNNMRDIANKIVGKSYYNGQIHDGY